MQARVWKLNNGTTVVLRLFEHSVEARKKLWDGTITLGEVDGVMLQMLKDFRVIEKIENWSSYKRGNIHSQDEFEESAQCHYFCWNVESRLLKF